MYSFVKCESAYFKRKPIAAWPLLYNNALTSLEGLGKKHNFRTSNTKRVAPGCVVDLIDLSDKSVVSLELVQPNNAIPRVSKISVLSLLGSSLLDLKTGDLKRVNLFSSCYEFQILRMHAPT